MSVYFPPSPYMPYNIRKQWENYNNIGKKRKKLSQYIKVINYIIKYINKEYRLIIIFIMYIIV